MIFSFCYIFFLFWPSSFSYVYFVDNLALISTQDGTYENPFSNIMSALSLILIQNYPQNYIIFSPNSIIELSSEIQLKNELFIKSLGVEESNSSYGNIFFLNDSRFFISSTLNIINSRIIIQSRNIESIFILLGGATINFKVNFRFFF